LTVEEETFFLYIYIFGFDFAAWNKDLRRIILV